MANNPVETEGADGCPSCGAALDSGAPEGLCRRCLVGSVLGLAEDLPSEDEPVLGLIGGYEIVERVAQGGMGAIYRARQPGLHREVAIKLIPEGKLAGAQDVERFRIEAEAAAELEHPNIVPIYEVGEEDGHHFYSMPLVGGGSLAGRVGEYAKNSGAVAALLEKVAGAVHHAHQRGILHRDLKPANILLGRDGEPMVTDFGLAKRIDGEAATLTQTGQILGSPAYIAPEIASGAGGASVLSDVYSLGVVLYQLLVGDVPFSGTTQMEVLRHVVDKEPPRPSQTVGGIPRDLETITLKCLEKDPTKRYSTAADLAADLVRWREGRPVEARPAGRLERAGKWIRRHPATAAIVGIVLLASAGLLAVLLESSARIRTERDFAVEQRRQAEMSSYSSDLAAAYAALWRGNLASAQAAMTRMAPEDGAEDYRDFAWRVAWLKCQGHSELTWKAHDYRIASMLFTPEGDQLVTGSVGGGQIRFWEPGDGERLLAFPEELGHGLMFRARREAHIAMGGLEEYERRVRWVPTGGAGHAHAMAFLPGGRFLAVAGGDVYLRLLDLEKKVPYGWWPVTMARVAALPKSGQMLVGGGVDEEKTTEGFAQIFDGKEPRELGAQLELEGAGERSAWPRTARPT